MLFTQLAPTVATHFMSLTYTQSATQSSFWLQHSSPHW